MVDGYFKKWQLKAVCFISRVILGLLVFQGQQGQQELEYREKRSLSCLQMFVTLTLYSDTYVKQNSDMKTWYLLLPRELRAQEDHQESEEFLAKVFLDLRFVQILVITSKGEDCCQKYSYHLGVQNSNWLIVKNKLNIKSEESNLWRTERTMKNIDSWWKHTWSCQLGIRNHSI